jgi:ABC-type multidrug transport system ATPase subunit
MEFSLNLKKNVTFIKADFLGDRIAIMSKGEMRCCGSPLYLKSKYSSGYNLVLTRKRNAESETDTANFIPNKIEIDNKIITFIKNIIPDAKINENLTSEVSFVLPSEQTSKFSELFQKLDANKDFLSIENIGISISTLEDVFLK